ncbi:cardiolipin synthase [Streptococcus rupicaprae]|uniref:Cardiolipin synthase n=2 Tax=Streptococcus TaxID=1301 RepID=A0A7X6MXL2_9STRE|nr:cardiolipin synthase [Streptococcus ovuberis]NKZ19604.1 cardiolipin synthase [Streptococcus ovuberis]
MKKLYTHLYRFGFYLFCALAILIEILAIILFFIFLADKAPFLWTLVGLIYIGSILSIINRNTAPENKVTWLVIIFVLPGVGSLFYLMFFERRIDKTERQHFKKIENRALRHVLPPQEHPILAKLQQTDPTTYNHLHALLTIDPSAQPYQETQASYFALGEDLWQQLLQDLRTAKHFIFMEYYIVELGQMWDAILAILLEKVAEGVEVRFLYDDIGCMVTLPNDYDNHLRQLGITAAKFNRMSPRASVVYNNRSHRKMTIIDGQIGYTGGINLADEYINAIERFGHWKDGGMRLEGQAVQGLTKLFLLNWDINSIEVSDFNHYQNMTQPVDSDGAIYVPYGSGPKPIYPRPVGKIVYLNLLKLAKHYVYITTPYLIIDYDLTEDLKNAALRGVEVIILMPFIADKPLIQIVNRSAYDELRGAGVRIFEYTPGFIHSKNFVVDDIYGVIGTINLDYRSLVHHYENAVFMYNSPVILDSKKDFLEALSVSQEIFDDTLKISKRHKLIKGIVEVFAPML